ncbi:MAG: hypothetical protein NZ772_10145 [Cyanobacteria bacterium]|nr:hypothetical protein [Cyanobacteriota bacterium]MDW8201359.1 hypothetical protein [Cyanobacteriota bacterium SKYGB_h_bin112]
MPGLRSAKYQPWRRICSRQLTVKVAIIHTPDFSDRGFSGAINGLVNGFACVL